MVMLVSLNLYNFIMKVWGIMMLESGKHITVSVIDKYSYGLLVSYGAYKGLIKTHELSWDIFGREDEVLEQYRVGDVIEVKVKHCLENTFYASVREKFPEVNPWFPENIPNVGEKFLVPVVRKAEYGCFVKLPNCAIALLRNKKVECVLEVGDLIGVIVDDIDECKEKISVIPSSLETE
jgi:ribosomal protein S1